MKTEIDPTSEEVDRVVRAIENREICRTAVQSYRLDVRRRDEVKASGMSDSGRLNWKDMLIGILLCASVIASAVYIAVTIINTSSGILRGIVITAGAWMLAGMGAVVIFLVACEARDRWGRR